MQSLKGKSVRLALLNLDLILCLCLSFTFFPVPASNFHFQSHRTQQYYGAHIDPYKIDDLMADRLFYLTRQA